MIYYGKTLFGSGPESTAVQGWDIFLGCIFLHKSLLFNKLQPLWSQTLAFFLITSLIKKSDLNVS